ncbi:hypothetical protein CRG98_011771 [Punica granatum]|uniref:Uncharacterized protein n=1 Tax=Punica granatum TaxID=22663 RepID=A0A2I0KH26_PUNGR|nr:hypothetical protein CRG98_011771 [Punica granatum]
MEGVLRIILDNCHSERAGPPYSVSGLSWSSLVWILLGPWYRGPITCPTSGRYSRYAFMVAKRPVGGRASHDGAKCGGATEEKVAAVKREKGLGRCKSCPQAMDSKTMHSDDTINRVLLSSQLGSKDSVDRGKEKSVAAASSSRKTATNSATNSATGVTCAWVDGGRDSSSSIEGRSAQEKCDSMARDLACKTTEDDVWVSRLPIEEKMQLRKAMRRLLELLTESRTYILEAKGMVSDDTRCAGKSSAATRRQCCSRGWQSSGYARCSPSY